MTNFQNIAKFLASLADFSLMSDVVENSSFVPVPIRDFTTGLSSPVDIYIKLSDEKFVLIVKQGEKATIDRVTHYENKKIDYLWVKKEDHEKIAKHTVIIAGIAINGDFSKKQKAKFVSAAASTIFTQLEHMGFSHNNFHQAREITQRTITLIEHHKDLFDLLNTLQSCSDEIVRHAMGVSSVSVLVALQMGWQNKTTMEKLSLGGLLVDIGLKLIPKELLKKPIAKMTPDEVGIYESHPYKGMEMATQLGTVPDDVISIIYEHEENALGQGFPRKLRGIKMHPMARVVALCNQFVRMVIPNVNNPHPRSPREAVIFMEQVMGQPHNKDAFEALRSMLGTNIGVSFKRNQTS